MKNEYALANSQHTHGLLCFVKDQLADQESGEGMGLFCVQNSVLLFSWSVGGWVS